MPFQIHIDILNFIFKGMLIGLIASAPMGPVGVLCVQRTLNKGRWYGFITGIGAALSDMIYAAITGYGMSYVMDVLSNQQTRMYLQIVGSIMLLTFGVYTYKSDPTKKIHRSGNGKDGAGSAIVYANRSMIFSESTTAFFAWCGQMRIHSPQSIHRSEIMMAFPPRTRIASVGQCLTQVVQPQHFSLSSFTEWANRVIVAHLPAPKRALRIPPVSGALPEGLRLSVP